jgi:hypothetical protein
MNYTKYTKYAFTHNRASRLAAVLGLTTLFAGMAAVTPAQAQDDYRQHQDRDHIRRDINDIHRDQDRLHDLSRRRDSEARRRDWDDVHALDRQINELKWHINHDRNDVHRDFDRTRLDRDRNYNRPLNSDFNRGRYQDDYRFRDGH